MNDRETWLERKNEAIKKHKAGEPLTLEETAFAMWNPDTEDKPMTPMGILKIEKRALEKLKQQLGKKKIFGLDDLFDPKCREYGRPLNTVEH